MFAHSSGSSTCSLSTPDTAPSGSQGSGEAFNSSSPPSSADVVSSASSASSSRTLPTHHSLLTSAFSSLHVPSAPSPYPPLTVVTRNVYHSAADVPRRESDEFGCCTCAPERAVEPPSACADDSCVNRSMLIECSAPCPQSGARCRNQRFARREYSPHLQVRLMGSKGYGVIATQRIPAHTFVIEYVGEVIPASLVPARLSSASSSSSTPHLYLLTLSRQLVIDATRCGNVGRFINHACDDNNCVTQRWTVQGRDRVGVFTCRDVEAGDELTFDYRWQRTAGPKLPCTCGKRRCRGWLGQKEKDDEDGEEEKDFSSRDSSAAESEEGRNSEAQRSKRRRYHDALYEHLAERWLQALDHPPPSAAAPASVELRLLQRCQQARAQQLEALLHHVAVEDGAALRGA